MNKKKVKKLMLELEGTKSYLKSVYTQSWSTRNKTKTYL